MIAKLIFVLFNTFLMLWVTSYIDDGVLEDDVEAREVIQIINVIAVFLLIIFFYPLGKFTDNFPAYITIPVSFISRAIAILAFHSLKTPNSLISIGVCGCLILTSLFEGVTVDGLFNKHLPKDCRGYLYSVYFLFGNLGILIYTKLGGYLYDNVGRTFPFILVGCLDVFFASITIMLYLCGKFHDWLKGVKIQEFAFLQFIYCEISLSSNNLKFIFQNN